MRIFSLKNLILLFSFLIVQVANSQEFPCDGTFYFVSTNTVVGSEFYKLNVNEVTQAFTYEQIPIDNPTGRHITAIGYNVRDKKIYGLDFDSYELLRINGDGSLDVLGVPLNLDTSFEYYAGSMTPDGRRLMVVARNKTTGVDERMYLINVNNPPDYLAGYFSVVSEVEVAMSDIAWDPIVGAAYGFDELNGQIVDTDLTGITTTFGFESVPQGIAALFFDRVGQLYGLGSPSNSGVSEKATMYAINKGNGTTSKLNTAAGGRDVDGCSCPYTLEFYKSITPQLTINCNEVLIEYNIVNKAGIGQVRTHLWDDLPPEFNIVDIQMENIFLVDVNSGIGSNNLDISEWDVVLGDNKVFVTARIENAAPGILKSQAHIEEFPLALDVQHVSDDPETELFKDPTCLEVISVDDLHLDDFAVTSCDLDTVYLGFPVQGEFLWSDGSTDSLLAVTEVGEYSVTVTTDCDLFMDTIFVDLDVPPLFVDLGADLQVELGDIVNLNFTSNAGMITNTNWSVSGDSILSCYLCPSPSFEAGLSSSYQITITDERGCSATDEIFVSVNEVKEIFAPNIFSPNDDGFNDLFYLQGKVGVIENLQIFNRWGNLVHQATNIPLNDQSLGWDGESKGQNLPRGVYLWTAEVLFPDDSVKRFSGDVMLVY